MSKVQDALDWIYSNPDRSQYAAAKKFGIGQSAISVALNNHNNDVAIYESVGPDKLNSIDAWASAHPEATVNSAAKQFNISPNTLRAAYRGQDVSARRKRLSIGQRTADPVAEMREKCAALVEAAGGEHRAHVAAAIRGLV